MVVQVGYLSFPYLGFCDVDYNAFQRENLIMVVQNKLPKFHDPLARTIPGNQLIFMAEMRMMVQHTSPLIP